MREGFDVSEHRFINQTLTVTGLIGLSLGGLVALCLFVAPTQRNAPVGASDRSPASLVAGQATQSSDQVGKYEKLNVGCGNLTQFNLPPSIERVMIIAQNCSRAGAQSRHNSEAPAAEPNSPGVKEATPPSIVSGQAPTIIRNLTTEIEASVFSLEDGHLSSDLVTLTQGVNRIEIVQNGLVAAKRFIEITRVP